MYMCSIYGPQHNVHHIIIHSYIFDCFLVYRKKILIAIIYIHVLPYPIPPHTAITTFSSFSSFLIPLRYSTLSLSGISSDIVDDGDVIYYMYIPVQQPRGTYAILHVHVHACVRYSYYVCLSGLWLGGLLYLSYFLS